MSMLSRQPVRPYRHLMIAALIGVPVGCCAVALHFTMFRSADGADAFNAIADIFSLSLFGYAAVSFLLVAYGVPALYLALKFRIAWPATAFSAALAPGIVSASTAGMSHELTLFCLAIGAVIGIAFVTLAYRHSPSDD